VIDPGSYQAKRQKDEKQGLCVFHISDLKVAASGKQACAI
jgi:hypothetical protein